MEGGILLQLRFHLRGSSLLVILSSFPVFQSLVCFFDPLRKKASEIFKTFFDRVPQIVHSIQLTHLEYEAPASETISPRHSITCPYPCPHNLETSIRNQEI